MQWFYMPQNTPASDSEVHQGIGGFGGMSGLVTVRKYKENMFR